MSYCHLTQYDRYLIWLGVSLNKSINCIATVVGKHRSSIYREIKRNINEQSGRYQHAIADKKSRQRRVLACLEQSKIKGELESLVIAGLNKGWSPEQIAGRLRLERRFSVCHETIYKYLYKDQKLGGVLWKLLRRSKPYRQKRFGPHKRGYPIRGTKNIQKRPTEASSRGRLGDFERDLIIGAKYTSHALLTIVDRKSRFLKIAKVKDKTAKEIHLATLGALKGEKKVHTITNDNGFEFADFTKTEKALNAEIYFTNPYSSWERGSIENANGLIRAYYKTGTSFKEITNAEIKKVEKTINERPRKTLGYRTPKEVHHQKNN